MYKRFWDHLPGCLFPQWRMEETLVGCWRDSVLINSLAGLDCIQENLDCEQQKILSMAFLWLNFQVVPKFANLHNWTSYILVQQIWIVGKKPGISIRILLTNTSILTISLKLTMFMMLTSIHPFNKSRRHFEYSIYDVIRGKIPWLFLSSYSLKP